MCGEQIGLFSLTKRDEGYCLLSLPGTRALDYFN